MEGAKKGREKRDEGLRITKRQELRDKGRGMRGEEVLRGLSAQMVRTRG